jgi:hypothetical protein
MKRCPECLFIYPDSDTRCDFDNTPLVVVDEAELEAATGASPSSPSSKAKAKRTPRTRARKALSFLAVVGLVFGVTAFVVYYSLAKRAHESAGQQSAAVDQQPIASVASSPVAAPQSANVSSSPAEAALPSPSPSATPSRFASERVVTSHSTATVAPVSTSGPGLGKKLGGKPVILLTSGGKIEADEVWRTRDGVWYRRAGIVTLLKPGRVKAIVNQ